MTNKETKQTNISGVAWGDYSTNKQNGQSDLTSEDWENATTRESESLELGLPLNVQPRETTWDFYLRTNLRHALEAMGLRTTIHVDIFLDVADHGEDLPLIIVAPISSQDLDRAHQPRKILWDHTHGTVLHLPRHIMSKSHGQTGNLGIDPESYDNENRLVFRVWRKPEFFALYPTTFENGDRYQYMCDYAKFAQYSPH